MRNASGAGATPLQRNRYRARGVNVSATTQPGPGTEADTVAVGLFEGEEAPSGLPGAATQLIAAGEARATPKALALAHADGKRWLLVGLGSART